MYIHTPAQLVFHFHRRSQLQTCFYLHLSLSVTHTHTHTHNIRQSTELPSHVFSFTAQHADRSFSSNVYLLLV